MLVKPNMTSRTVGSLWCFNLSADLKSTGADGLPRLHIKKFGKPLLAEGQQLMPSLTFYRAWQKLWNFKSYCWCLKLCTKWKCICRAGFGTLTAMFRGLRQHALHGPRDGYWRSNISNKSFWTKFISMLTPSFLNARQMRSNVNGKQFDHLTVFDLTKFPQARTGRTVQTPGVVASLLGFAREYIVVWEHKVRIALEEKLLSNALGPLNPKHEWTTKWPLAVNWNRKLLNPNVPTTWFAGGLHSHQSDSCSCGWTLSFLAGVILTYPHNTW